MNSDLASTGGTIAGAAQALLQAGAQEVQAFFIHAVMAPGALERMRAVAGADLRVVPTAPLFAAAPREELR